MVDECGTSRWELLLGDVQGAFLWGWPSAPSASSSSLAGTGARAGDVVHGGSRCTH